MTRINIALCLVLIFQGLMLGAQDIPERRDTITESVVVTEKKHTENFTQTGLTKIDPKRFRTYAAFSTPDVIKVLQTLPGVACGTELMSGLYVHGGDGSDNLFLLDGVPIYQVSHVAGLFSSFNTDMVDNLDFYKSGFPARYGGKLSSVVDVSTKDGDFNKYHGSFSIGLIDGRFNLEGPLVKGRTSFNIGLRRSWMDAVTIPAVAIINKKNNEESTGDDREDINFHYAFDDFNAKVTHIFKPGSKLTFNLYQGNDGVKIFDDYKNTGTRGIEGGPNEVWHSQEIVDVGVKWGNFTSSLAWDKEFSDKLHSNIKAYYTQSTSDINLQIQDLNDDYSENIQETNKTAVKDWSVAADIDWYPDNFQHIRGGVQYQHHIYNPSRCHLIEEKDLIEPEFDTYIKEPSSSRFTGEEAALYAEDELSVSRNLKANVGVRSALFFVPGRTWARLEPRAAVKWQYDDNSSFKLSYSEMNQFNHLVATMYLDLPTNCWMPSTATIKPSLSRQIAGGWYNSWNSGMRLNIEGYWKTMEHLLEYGGQNALFPPLNAWETNFYEGQGRSYGTEFEWGYDLPKWSFTTYYTLSWSERKFDDIYVDWYPDRNDNRHKVNINVNWRPSKKFELYAMWNFHSGNRITTASHVVTQDRVGSYYDYMTGEEIIHTYKVAFDLYSSPNNLRLPNYHRLDLGLNFFKETKRGNQSIWNLSIYNAYCRMNPILAYVGRNDKHELVEFTEGIVPIIPTFSYTIKF